jgi:GxxExxY protein
MEENELSYSIIGSALDIHKSLGPGLLESVYENTLAYELRKKGLVVEQQVPMPLVYKDVKFEAGFRLDILVNKKVIVEVKSIEALAPVHHSQVLTYLKLSERKLGLLINFNTARLKDQIHRIFTLSALCVFLALFA